MRCGAKEIQINACMLGYELQEYILNFERSAYRQSKVPSGDMFKAKFNQAVAREIKHLMYRFNDMDRLAQFKATK